MNNNDVPSAILHNGYTIWNDSELEGIPESAIRSRPRSEIKFFMECSQPQREEYSIAGCKNGISYIARVKKEKEVNSIDVYDVYENLLFSATCIGNVRVCVENALDDWMFVN